MVFVDVIAALFVGLCITLLISALFRVSSPSGIFLFFGIVFLAAWVGGIWVTPFGPVLWGTSIFPFLFFGLLVGLLIAALSPTWYRPRNRAEAVEQIKEEREAEIVFSGMLWVFLIALVISIVVRYTVYSAVV